MLDAEGTTKADGRRVTIVGTSRPYVSIPKSELVTRFILDPRNHNWGIVEIIHSNESYVISTRSYLNYFTSTYTTSSPPSLRMNAILYDCPLLQLIASANLKGLKYGLGGDPATWVVV